jgi:GT2 family glycosyltransferase/2-polyprenyl-3-methyl-5-hydroxy-6-metoxy-1,4-benzoquinol methylase/glycosyltransferase involved in cell wall biosynthesis
MHVYQRTVSGDSQDSLSIIANLIGSGQSLLDLGMGGGALGRYLNERMSIDADGVTLNQAEADLARAWYQRVVVTDLDTSNLHDLFGAKLYDVIVCADVLEHLKVPQRVLDQCRTLLKPGGRLIVSVPNVGYGGLVAELLQGDFRYRPEGLLDNTHLRFFTRASMARFFDEAGWHIGSIETTTRSLNESEFKVAFDSLPPAVARYVLAMPDAAVYQFVVVAVPEKSETNGISDAHLENLSIALKQSPAQALFSAELFLGVEGSFNQNSKVVASGTIGQSHQTIVFDVPASSSAYTGMRLDPADRPGFFKLHQMNLRLPDGQVVWRWESDRENLEQLKELPHQDVLFQQPWELMDGVLLFLFGDDPWVHLPIPAQILANISGRGGQLEVVAGWPMSADYLVASAITRELETRLRKTLSEREVEFEKIGAIRKVEFENLVLQHHAELNKVNLNHQIQLESVGLNHQTELAAVASNHQAELATVAANRQAELKVVVTKHQTELEIIASKHQSELELLALDHQTQLELVSAQLSDSRLALSEMELTKLELQQHGAVRETKITHYALALREVQQEKTNLTRELQASMSQTKSEQVRFQQLLTHLQTIEQSTVFRLTRPIVRLKMKFDRAFGRVPQGEEPKRETLPQVLPRPFPSARVDIIVPVYRGLEDTRCCVESVLNSNCNTEWRLIIINDCSPEPEVTQWLRTVANEDKRIELYENEENLGFVGTVNRGMALSNEHDVLLLNSDAEVANDWLDRIQRAAYSMPNVASVTPFSNNATICSYPRFCQPNDLPANFNTAKLDLLFATYLAGQTLPIPTGVGFCMYIRRKCLQEVGFFDEVNFGKGYGEENDFCVRAQHSGWVNLHALDTFVRHAGGVSFGDSKSEREQQAIRTLNRLHPDYEPSVHDFVRTDPASNARLAIDLARITGAGKPVILNITHNREGGTLRHIQELAQNLAEEAVFLRLWPVPKGVQICLEGAHEVFQLFFEIPQEQEQLVIALQTLQVSHIHYHHLLGHAPGIDELPERLGVSYDFTAHDYFSLCPQISLTDHTDRYCGEEGLDQCATCLQRHPAPGGQSIEVWRSQNARLLKDTRYLLTPSEDTAARMRLFVPLAHVLAVPHLKLLRQSPPHPDPTPKAVMETRPLKIAVLGALSKIKGADVLESVASLAAEQNAPIEFHLIGYAYRNLRTQPKASLTVHGAYDDADLAKILDWLQPDVVWFPAVWPETYSYTLSACLEGGWPVVAPNIGSFVERLGGRPWSWVCDWQQGSAAWVDFFVTIRAQNFRTAVPPALTRPSCSVRQNAEDSFDYYREYLAELPVHKAPEPGQLRASIEAWQPVRIQDTIHLKSSALRAIIRLRATALLSPLAKMVPMHMQRRVKSWLGK